MATSTDEDGKILRAEGLQGPYYGLQPLSNPNVEELRRDFFSISALVNAGAPVNKLPHEVLLMVFLFTQAKTEEGAAPDWPAILLVCRRWFVVAATAPHFWRNLVVGKSLNLLRTGLVRSKGFTIGVSVVNRRAVPEAANMILPHLNRLHSLSISSIHQRHKVYVASLMQHPMPVLERFKAIVEKPTSWVVNAENPSLGIPRMPLSVNDFPKLRSLTVEQIVIPPSADAVYKQLTVLHLSCWGPQIHDYDKFVEILRSCVNVEDLAVELGESGLNPGTEKVVLPKLRTLQVRGWRLFLRDILHTITIPATVDLSIHLGGPEGESGLRKQSISAILPDDYQTVLPVFSSVTTVHAQARESEDVLVAYTPANNSESERRRLSLRMPIISKEHHGYLSSLLSDEQEEPEEPEDPREVVRSLRKLSVFSVAPVQTLHIEIEATKVNYVDWREAFRHFPLLQGFNIVVQGRHPEPSDVLVLYALGPAKPKPQGSKGGASATSNVVGPPPCPHLRVLRMRGFRATAGPGDSWRFSKEVNLSVDMLELLCKRRDAGCDAIEELVLDLDCLDEKKWAMVDERRTACSDALEDLVGRLEYEERQNWRDVFAYKDEW